MTQVRLALPTALARFAEDQVRSGAYPDVETLIHEALLGMMPRVKSDAFRGQRLKDLVQVGLDELDRGEAIEVTDVKAWLNSLGRRSADEAA